MNCSNFDKKTSQTNLIRHARTLFRTVDNNSVAELHVPHQLDPPLWKKKREYSKVIYLKYEIIRFKCLIFQSCYLSSAMFMLFCEYDENVMKTTVTKLSIGTSFKTEDNFIRSN